MYNLLRTTALILISTLFATSASAQELKPGELCAGFAGPVGACPRDYVCCYISPDNAVCTSKYECPF
ncbi:hypothetical protein E4T56_gene11440 [Termitomyces sp. T112]|nr:hypothetical protein E4T56_gene11440 [Termitomyces sp. T112]